MSEILALFAALSLLAAVLAHIAIWAPRRLWVKIAALVTTTAFMPVAYASLVTMLSRPKPIEMEWSRQAMADAAVLGARMEEGSAIYVWLQIEGVADPRAYVLPWSEEMARQLHGAQRDAEQTGTQVRMRDPFEESLDEREQVFYAAPMPPPPPKEDTAQNTLRFPHSGSTPNQ